MAASYQSSFHIALPDLSAGNLVVPSETYTGGEISIGWRVTNVGSGPADAPWQDRVYLSDDDQFGGDTLLYSVDHSTPLNSGQWYDQTIQVGVPAVAEGQYWIIVKSDVGGSVYESNEDNNVVVSNPITIRRPNLTITDPLAPSEAGTGQQVEIHWTVTNTATVPAVGDWQDRIYLSSDDQVGDDTLLGTFGRPFELAAGEHYDRTGHGDDSSGGTRSILDHHQERLCRYAAGSQRKRQHIVVGPIEIRTPDLQVTAVAAPAEGWSGRAIDVSWTVTNTGSGEALGSWLDKVYLSADDQVGGDIYLGQLANPVTLAAGQSYTRSGAFTLPEGISGDYRIIVVTDANAQLYEQDESNNAAIGAAFPVYLTPYADLQVTAVAVPPTATAGQQATFSWTVTNAGNGATNAAAWVDKVYLSADRILGGDTLIGTVANPSYLARRRIVRAVVDGQHPQHPHRPILRDCRHGCRTSRSTSTFTRATTPLPAILRSASSRGRVRASCTFPA